jgi:hypothetical protein
VHAAPTPQVAVALDDLLGPVPIAHPLTPEPGEASTTAAAAAAASAAAGGPQPQQRHHHHHLQQQPEGSQPREGPCSDEQQPGAADPVASLARALARLGYCVSIRTTNTGVGTSGGGGGGGSGGGAGGTSSAAAFAGRQVATSEGFVPPPPPAGEGGEGSPAAAVAAPARGVAGAAKHRFVRVAQQDGLMRSPVIVDCQFREQFELAQATQRCARVRAGAGTGVRCRLPRRGLWSRRLPAADAGILQEPGGAGVPVSAPGSCVHPPPSSPRPPCRYQAVLASLPGTLVLLESRLWHVVSALCTEMALCFEARGSQLPPWRDPVLLAAKWLPRSHVDVPVLPGD